MPSRASIASPILLWTISAALAGFIFGFDIVVISGAEQKIQRLWGLSDWNQGLAISAALWGTVFGALIGGIPTDRFGRRPTLIAIALLYLVSALGSGLAPNFPLFTLARFIGGIGVGISTIAVPLYLSEISPAGKRGRLTGQFQLNIVLGILGGFLSNYLIRLSFPEESAWRWMLGIEALPAAIYTIAVFYIPESPRWLIIKRQNRAAALPVLRQIHPEYDDHRIDAKAEEIERSARLTSKPSLHTAHTRFPLRTAVSLAFLIAFFNQLSGINAVITFAPRIFELAGLGEKSALLQTAGIGVTNLVFTLVGLAAIDRFGRRTLLIVGGTGYIIALTLIMRAFASGNEASVPIWIFVFIAAHAIGQGTVIWVFISEIFPAARRSLGTTIGSSTHWIFAALLTLFFPGMITRFSPTQIFGFFLGMMVLHLIWVLWKVPETKGRSLEEIDLSEH